MGEEAFGGFGEMHGPSFRAASDARMAFYRLALAAYDYRCALTGIQYARDGLQLDKLHVVFIQPREAGGPLEMGNAIVFSPAAAMAFAAGWFTMSDDGRLLLAQSVETLRAHDLSVVAGQALFLPRDPVFRPVSRYLQFHRLVIAQYDRA